MESAFGRGGRQVIPRPATARAGGPAPWAALPEPRRRPIGAARVAEAVRSHHHALRGAERVVVDGIPDPGAPAAVLVPVFEEDGEARVVLTRRAAHLRSHRGEVSFPGGRLEEGESPERGALREAAEEVGLDPAGIELVGRLSKLGTVSSGTTITPVVALLPGRPALAANPTEVEHVFDAALSDLADPACFREERWAIPGRGDDFPVWFFELADDTIWGATARMLVELLRLVLSV